LADRVEREVRHPGCAGERRIAATDRLRKRCGGDDPVCGRDRHDRSPAGEERNHPGAATRLIVKTSGWSNKQQLVFCTVFTFPVSCYP
jgi:hypothetical protein